MVASCSLLDFYAKRGVHLFLGVFLLLGEYFDERLFDD